MNNNTRKIVVLNNIKSPKIEQAIFILRDDTDCTETDAVSEAEKIVRMYLEDLQRPIMVHADKKSKFPIVLGSIMCVVFTFLVAACVLNLIK